MTLLNSRFIAFFLITQMAFFSSCASTPQFEGAREQYDDIVITTKVHEAILDEPSLRPFDINVRTTKGVVELSGLVNSRDDMYKAIAIARSVSGIKFIKNDMRIPGTGDY
ncbi:BON domain-containing protein [Nitrosomonas sp.]|uniref:BON domain-containing protein n=1 Tax=Nitrosomonas sp. TaxID=42353 RepID=UPI0025ECA72B|nr:BON domain-containing protein [Nitrosomonas sp.]